MQSILQYRHFRKQLVEQSEREPEEKARIPSGGEEVLSDEEAEQLPEPSEGPADSIDHDTIHGGDVERADVQVEIRGSLSTIDTRQSMGNAVSLRVTGVEMRTDAEAPSEKQFVVLFEGEDDQTDPRNWSFRKRLKCTLILSLVGASIEYSTVVDSRAFQQALEQFEFHLRDQKLFLVTGMFLIGIGLGSLLTGPFSEVLGRNPVYVVTMAIKMLFSMGSGLAKTYYTANAVERIIFRFFGGLFGSASLVCTNAAISDLWTRRERVYMFPLYTCLVLTAPMFAALIDSIIVRYSSGRFVHWTNLALVGVAWLIMLFFLPETYIPVLLQWKARHMRKITGDVRYRAPIELKRVSFLSRLGHALWRPFVLICRDRIIAILAAYMSIIYVTLFTLYIGFPYVFSQIYRWRAEEMGLSYLACIAGAILCVPAVYRTWNTCKKEGSRYTDLGCHRVKPEVSLQLAMLGAPAIPIAIFWMAWTVRPSISPASPLIAAALFTYGAICLIISLFQYVTDSFHCYVASAQAALIMPRYISAGLMAEAAIPLYKHAGTGWTLSIIGILSLLMTPVPYILYKYGPRLRSRSSFIRSL